MRPVHIGGACVGVLMIATASAGQQPAATPEPSPKPASRVIEYEYPSGAPLPFRRVQTRRTSDRRETVIETVEMPGLENKWQPYQESRTETLRVAPDIVRTTRDVFGFGPQGQRVLRETTQSEQSGAEGGDTSEVHATWVTDLDGRLDLSSREIHTTKSIASGTRQAVTTLLRPGINGALQESERTVSIDRQLSPSVARHDATQSIRDVNGRWQPVETRAVDVRQIGPSEWREEETIHRPDLSGNLTLSDRVVTRHSTANGRESLVIEIYSQNEGLVRFDMRPALTQRVRSTTTATADGGRETVEEVEARSLVAPADPLRVVRRSVVTVRRLGPVRWLTERRVFEMDVNGRMAPVLVDTEETVER
jgi:hypothetical protein